MDHIGHPMTSSSVTQVKKKVIDIDDILEKMKASEQKQMLEIQKLITLTGNQDSKLKTQKAQIESQKAQIEVLKMVTENQTNTIVNQQVQIDQLETTTSSQTAALHEQKLNIESQSAQITEQKSDMRSVLTRLDESRDAIMESQTNYGGHAYFLSRPVTWNTHRADSWCRLFGGYLVEVNSQAEYQFVWDWVKGNNFGEWVFISGSDEGHEGHYTYFHSGRPVDYFSWSINEPNQGTSGNCLHFNINRSAGMFDGVCNDFKSNNGPARFICERDS